MKFLIGYITARSRPHKHKNYEIIAYLKGTGTFCSPQKDIPVSPGRFIIVPPELTHSSEHTEDVERIYINGDFNHIFSFSSPLVISDNAEGTGILLAKMIYNNRYANPEYISALTNAFTHFLIQNIKAEKDINITIKNIVNYICDNFYDSNLNLNELLKRTGYAEDYIRAQFRVFTGKTPTEFLTEARISHACYLIDVYKGSLSLTEISEKCGYTDYVYFSRRFKQIIGVSPKEYASA